jgi:hypothetical protein
LGPSLVDALDAPEAEKHRLRIVLRTIASEITIAQACEELGVGESRFHEIRRTALEGALAALGPQPIGRPRRATQVEATVREIAALRSRVAELERTLTVAQLRANLLTLGDASPGPESAPPESVSSQKKTPSRADKHRLRKEHKRRRKQKHRRAR